MKGEKLMADLIRKIEEKDIPELKNILKIVFNDENYKDIKRLGGMTNHSYKVTRNDNKEYLVRIPGEGTEEMINRLDEKKSTELACSLGIDTKLLYFDDKGHKVMDFICEPQNIDEKILSKNENIEQIAKIFKTLHTCNVDTGVKFEVFEMANLYEKIINDGHVKNYDDYNNVKTKIMQIKTKFDSIKEPVKVPCHNDSLIGNWVMDKNGKLYLVDWEYSGMNEAMWDLSCLSIEMGYNEEQDNYFLKSYYGREVSIDEKKRFVASKLYVDFLWTLWGLTRVPYDGEFMQEYADNRYQRLKNNLDFYNKLER